MVKNNSSITEFYAGKSIFVTGGTGFIGKVLVEKLLYTCRDIDKVYILIRGTANATSEQRLQELIKKPVFERLMKENPQSLNKIVAVPGDIAENHLGISSQDEQSFIDKISVVFHSAATVMFNERLDVALNLNYEATKRIINVCHRMNNLKSFVHMSTAFINPQSKCLDEMVYPSPVQPKELEEFLQQTGLDDEEKLKKFLCGRPNTYTFAKALAENYVAENHGTIPTAIIRPSVVTSAAFEPTPGWIDTWSAAAAIVATTSLGYNRVVVGKSSNVLDLIPIDYVTNLAIVAGARNSNKLQVFNSCTSSCNPLSISDTYNICTNYVVKNGYNDLPVPFTVMTKDTLTKDIAVFLLEKLPSIMCDLYRQLRGKEPRYVKLQSRVSVNREHLKFFTSRSFNMSADKTIALSRSLSERDARLFPMNPKDINWKKYLPEYIRGIRKYLLKK